MNAKISEKFKNKYYKIKYDNDKKKVTKKKNKQ